jgi:hypothetical protein
MMARDQELDALIRDSLKALAADPHVMRWRAKENNWVSYYDWAGPPGRKPAVRERRDDMMAENG